MSNNKFMLEHLLLTIQNTEKGTVIYDLLENQISLIKHIDFLERKIKVLNAKVNTSSITFTKK